MEIRNTSPNPLLNKQHLKSINNTNPIVSIAQASFTILSLAIGAACVAAPFIFKGTLLFSTSTFLITGIAIIVLSLIILNIAKKILLSSPKQSDAIKEPNNQEQIEQNDIEISDDEYERIWSSNQGVIIDDDSDNEEKVKLDDVYLDYEKDCIVDTKNPEANNPQKNASPKEKKHNKRNLQKTPLSNNNNNSVFDEIDFSQIDISDENLHKAQEEAKENIPELKKEIEIVSKMTEDEFNKYKPTIINKTIEKVKKEMGWKYNLATSGMINSQISQAINVITKDEYLQGQVVSLTTAQDPEIAKQLMSAIKNNNHEAVQTIIDTITDSHNIPVIEGID